MLVKPGVRFMDLHAYLEEHGLREKVWLDVSSLPSKSGDCADVVLGSGFGRWEYHWQCSREGRGLYFLWRTPPPSCQRPSC